MPITDRKLRETIESRPSICEKRHHRKEVTNEKVKSIGKARVIIYLFRAVAENTYCTYLQLLMNIIEHVLRKMR